MVKLVGEDHVGVGFGAGEIRTPAEARFLRSLAAGSGAPPKHRYVEQLNTPTKVPNLTRGLVERGYSEATIKKMLGENLMRVFAKSGPRHTSRSLVLRMELGHQHRKEGKGPASSA